MEKILKTTKNEPEKINLSNIYKEKEIESLKKIFPQLSSLIVSLPSKSSKLSSLKSTKLSLFIEKEKFVKLISEKMIDTFKSEGSEILAKSLPYLLDNASNDIEIKKVSAFKRNSDNTAKLTKNQIYVDFSGKEKNNGDEVMFKKKSPKKILLNDKNAKNRTNYPQIKRKMNINLNKMDSDNTVRNKLGKKIIGVKFDADNSNFKVKNIKSNSINNNFITFSNSTNPEQIYIYGNKSSNSRKSNALSNSNISKKKKIKDDKNKLLSLHSITNYALTEKNRNIFNNMINKSKKKKFNTRKSNIVDSFSINFIKKINKINTEVNFDKRKATQRTKKRPSNNNKINKTTINLTNISSNNTGNKKLSFQIKPSLKEKELSPIISPDPTIYSNIESKDFDIFSFESSVGKENTLYLIGSYIYKKFDFSKIIKQEKFANWSKKIASGYSRQNPYHTDLHAADVSQTCFLSLIQEGVQEISKVDNTDICVLILSCMCHDFKHGGLNNNFLRLTKHKLAIRYNDISILENMHISETFKLINSNPECDIFTGVDKPTYEKMRKKMISCVLSTDMTYHSKHMDFMKNVIEKKTDDIKDNQEFMNLLVHASDISNPTKPFNVYFKWAKLVVEEFCQQGDKEKALGLKCTCDRKTVQLGKNQLGFIDFVVEAFVSSYVTIYPSLNFLHDNLVINREKFANYKEDENNDNNNKK